MLEVFGAGLDQLGSVSAFVDFVCPRKADGRDFGAYGLQFGVKGNHKVVEGYEEDGEALEDIPKVSECILNAFEVGGGRHKAEQQCNAGVLLAEQNMLGCMDFHIDDGCRI